MQVMRLLGMSADEVKAANAPQQNTSQAIGTATGVHASDQVPAGVKSSTAALRQGGNIAAAMPGRPGPALGHPSNMILKLAAGAKSRSAGDSDAPRVNLRQPLHSGVAGDQLLSPQVPAPSPTFWQPFGTGVQQGRVIANRTDAIAAANPNGRGVRPVSAPSPKRAWAGCGPFDGAALPSLDQEVAAVQPSAEDSRWRAFGDSSPDTPCAQMASWQPFHGDSNASGDAWAVPHAPAHSVSVPVGWSGNAPQGLNCSTTAPQRANGTGHARSRSQTSDLLSTWPHRSMKDGMPLGTACCIYCCFTKR